MISAEVRALTGATWRRGSHGGVLCVLSHPYWVTLYIYDYSIVYCAFVLMRLVTVLKM